jgi:hypothetical protein
MLILAAVLAAPGAVLGDTVEAFGQKVAEALQSGNGAAFTGFIDREVLTGQVLAGMEGDEKFMSGVRSGLNRGLVQIGDLLVNNLGPSTRLKYLRARTIEGNTRVLIRVDLGERGLNYLDLMVKQRPDGSWSIVDWHDYAQGQTYTTSLRMALALMVPDKPSMLRELFNLPNIDTALVKRIASMGNYGRQGDWAGWLEVYRTLPEKVRQSRVLLVGRMAASTMTGDDDEYMASMADLHTYHGDDPTLSLALVDYYLIREDYTQAFAAVDQLDRYTGGDAALTNLRSGLALYKGDNGASVKYARQAIAEDVLLEDPYWNLMTAGSRAGDYKAAMEGVVGLEKRFGYEFSEEDLLASEDFSGLVQSEEWRAH